MNTNNTYRRFKSIVTGIAFILIAFSLIHNPHDGISHYVATTFPLYAFIFFMLISGVMNVVTGILLLPCNALWYAAFYAYASLSYLAWVDGTIHPSVPIIYTLLSILLSLDIIVDIKHKGLLSWKVKQVQ